MCVFKTVLFEGDMEVS